MGFPAVMNQSENSSASTSDCHTTFLKPALAPVSHHVSLGTYAVPYSSTQRYPNMLGNFTGACSDYVVPLTRMPLLSSLSFSITEILPIFYNSAQTSSPP